MLYNWYEGEGRENVICWEPPDHYGARHLQVVNLIHLNVQYFSKVGENLSTEKEIENYRNLESCSEDLWRTKELHLINFDIDVWLN